MLKRGKNAKKVKLSLQELSIESFQTSNLNGGDVAPISFSICRSMNDDCYTDFLCSQLPETCNTWEFSCQ